MRHDSVEAGGRMRTYTVAGPEDGKPGRDLILLFHGSKQTGDAHRKFTGAAYGAAPADDGTAVVAYLDGYKRNWNDACRGISFPAARKTSTTSPSPGRSARS